MGRLRRPTVTVLVMLLVGGCGSADGEGGVVSTVPTTTEAATTQGATTTTTMGPATTTSLSPSGTVLPQAQPSIAVPWEDIETAAFLVVVTTPEAVGLELVTGDGPIYEVAQWPDDARGRSVLDVDLDGRRALIGIGREAGVARASLGAVTLLDLTTGHEQEVFAAPPAPDDGVPWPAPQAAFDPAGGDMVLVTWSDGTTDRIERLDLAGTSSGVMAEQPAALVDALSWVVTPSGDELVMGGADGIRLTDLDGETQARLDTPGLHCRPLRAWSGDDLLVRCNPDWGGPYFEQLWLLPFDGSAAAPLTGLIEWGADDGCGGECGYTNAWPWGDEVLAQWWAYDRVAEIHRIDADGAGMKLDVGSGADSADFLVAGEGQRLAVLSRPVDCLSCFSFFGWIDDGERIPLLTAPQGLGVLQIVPIG